ncbi:MAG: DUF3558 domain-containing protein [Chloroflexi bacterium]|nr:DUF3558 domain-containing protein [Chloroflexota bacterium]
MRRLRHRSWIVSTVLTVSLAGLLAACGAAAGPAGPGGATGSADGASGDPGGAGAGGGPTQAPPASSIAACGLLTDAEIKEVTTYDILSKEAGPQQGIYQNGCNWKLASGTEGIPWEIVVGVVSPGGRSYYDRYFSMMNYEPVAGVDADIAVEQDLTDSYMAVKGDTMVDIQYIELRMGGGNPDGKALELLKRMLGHLG